MEGREKVGTNIGIKYGIFRHGAPPFENINKNPFIHSGTKGQLRGTTRIM
jgi:hypothetical protein